MCDHFGIPLRTDTHAQMPISLFNIHRLLPAIEANALILTPNSRLKNKLVAAYNQHNQAKSLMSWPAPRVYSLTEWVNETHQTFADRAALTEPLCLASDFVVQQLWLEIILDDNLGAELINPQRLAADAQAAHKTLQRWNLSVDDIDTNDSESSLPLIKWVQAFEQALKERGLCTAENVQQQLIDGFKDNDSLKEALLILLGFDDIPPLNQTLFDSIALQQQTMAALSGPANSSRCQLVSCPTPEDELRAAARWAHEILSKDPSASIGIIAPNLGQIRKQTEQVFIDVLEPHYALPETPRYTLPFNFSAGVPLGSVPFIHDTLALLQLNLHHCSVEKLLAAFLSPFWGIGENMLAASQIIYELQRHPRERIKSSQLRHIVHAISEQTQSKDGTNKAPAKILCHWLDDALQQFESMRRQRPTQLMPSEWLELFESQLRRLQWPGDRRLDSNEYQQMNQWYQLQEKFCHLDSLGKTFTSTQALDLLTQLANSEHFQAQTPESPIQILGILEGAGLQFSHCWVLGMSQRSWPAAPEPNPLLPLSMQRQYAMPHADADRELGFAQRLTEGYKQCAQHIVFSHPVRDEDTPVQASALMHGITSINLDEFLASDDIGWNQYTRQVASQNHLDWVNTGNAPGVSEAELERLRGGTQILKNQAAAPYAAFLLHRLGAQQPQSIAAGFTPIQRGQILHDALSTIWSEIGDQATLINTEKQQLTELIRRSVEHEISKFRRLEPDVFGENYVNLEAQRQTQLITQWLSLEMLRPPFKVVANEESISVNFAGLPLNLRLDRMDQLDSGELLLIDYKTGKPSPKSWGGERPDEPQLPLYCLCFNADINAILFAQINTSQTIIKGLGELSVAIEGVTPAAKASQLQLPETWQEILQHWKLTLETLTCDFLSGDCSLEFKNPSVRRFYEDLSPIMRWQEEEDIRRLRLPPGAVQ